MICNNCKEDRNTKDFFLDNLYCYKCIYEIKTKNLKKRKTSSEKYCKICQKKFGDLAENKYRTSFCSIECATIGQKEQSKNYWFKNIQSHSVPLY